MGYKMDMRGETGKKKLLPEGVRIFTIIGCKEAKSKQGNDMFVFTFEDEETKQPEEVYAISTQGKRWFLKEILAACNVPAAEDGIYDWEISDVMDKRVAGRVEHIADSWVNREGKTIETKKHKIVEISETTPF